MADETLRMRAEVEDRFSGPLKALRSQLLDTSRQGAAHGEALAKGLNKAETAAQATANTAKTVLNPALAAIGVTGLGAGVAVSGVISALNSLGSNLSGLGALSRETGMAADQLRIFQSVAGKFGISSDASSAAAKTFSENMRDIRRGAGEISGFLQSQNTVIAQYYQKLRGTKDNDQANKIAEDMLEHVPNPVDRARLAARVYGNADLGRLGDGSKGPIADVNRAAEQKLGPLPKGAVESAEKYERSLADLRSSMEKVGDSIARELLPPAERFVTWMDGLVSGQRKDLTDGIRNGIREIGAELSKVDWKGAGESAKDMLLSTTALVKPLADSVKEIAAAIQSFNNGKVIEGLRHLDGGHGPLARRLAPLPGDEKFANEEAAGDLRSKIGTAKEQGTLQSDLLKELDERGDKDGAKRLREAMDANSRHLKSLEDALQKLLDQGATAQKSSAEGDGPFAGARVQTASLGGGARLYGGGSGPGYRGEQGERDAAREQFREHLKKTVPGYDGGSTVPLAPGIRIPEMSGAGRLRGIGGGRGAMPGIPDNVPMTASERNTLGLIMKYESHGQNTMNYEGKRQGLDPQTAKGYTAQGYYQMLNSNWRRIAPGLGIKAPNAMSGSLDEQTRVALHLLRNGGVKNWSNYNPALRGALARGEQAPVASIPSLAPTAGGADRRIPSLADGDFLPNGTPRVLKPNSMKDAPGVTMEEANRLRGGQADGDGWASREKARKAFEAMQKGEGRLDASAGRAGVVGGTKVEASGSVSVVVQKPGPDTNIRTSASGNLFRDVVLSRGRTMAPAERT